MENEVEEKGCRMNWNRKDVGQTGRERMQDELEEKGCRTNWKRKDVG